jgi:genome maintenance exonuclease 1
MEFKYEKVPGLDYQLPVVTTSDGRYYETPGGRRYPSASTISGLINRKVIERWRQRVGTEVADKKTKRGADRGTYVHLLCEKYLLGTMTLQEKLGMLPSMKELFLQLRGAFDAHISTVYCIEQALYSDRLRIAGRTDGVVLWDGEIAILDVKTAGYVKPESWVLNYFVQTAAYAEMYEERTGIKINKLVLATAVEDSAIPCIYVKEKGAYLPALNDCIAEFYAEQEAK